MTIEDDIQAAAEQDSIVTGAKETIKHAPDLTRIVIAANTPPALTERVEETADEEDVEVTHLDADNVELGSLCMKPYAAAVIGIKE